MAEPTDPIDTKSPIDLVVVAGDLATRLSRPPVSVSWEHAASLLQITSALADAVSADAVYEAIVDRVASLLDASSCALWLCDSRMLRRVRHVGYSAVVADVAIKSDVSNPMLDAFRSGTPIWIPSQRVSCLPLVADGCTVGVLEITDGEESESSESERSFLIAVARFAAQAVERLRILEAERKSRARADAIALRMTILSHASRAFADAHVDHEQRLRNIVREVGTLMDAATSIGLVPESGGLQLAATYHPDSAQSVSLDEDEGASVMKSGQPLLLGSSTMIAPLRVQGRSIGTLCAVRARAGQSFDQNDLELLQGLADRAASAIENSRLHRDAEEARRRAEQLYAFASAAVNAQTLEQVFDAALTAIVEALRVKRASILLFDDQGAMRFQAWRGLSDAYRAAVDGHSPWKREDKAPQPVLVADCLNEPAWASYQALFRSEDIGALAFIPLVNRGELVGKFMVYYDEPHAFTANDVEISRAIANHLASMIARFRALAELERTVRDNELFAGVLAHDLRNPLSAIVTAAQILLMRNEGAAERPTTPLSRIMSSAQRMTNMITQLLDFTRARVGGGIEIGPRNTSLLDVATQAVAELELAFPNRKASVAAHGDPHGVWDPDRLLQVISNVVANAFQHGTPACAVDVTIDARSADAVSLAVHNDGAIPPALLPQLFEPFRGSERRYGGSHGLGLGLYIVREIVRAHHGTVEVTSSEEAGTTFVVRLPRQRP
jgi:K+-sensing histidine kinase KdpD